jgi:hypothetical protein
LRSAQRRQRPDCGGSQKLAAMRIGHDGLLMRAAA